MAEDPQYNKLNIMKDVLLFDLTSDTSTDYVSYSRITGELDKMTNLTNPDDQLGTKTVHLLVPHRKQATITVDNFAVDDWGFVDIKAAAETNWNNGVTKRLVDLTSDRESPGPRGGHAEWSDSSEAVTLPAGKYDITVSQTNQPYNESYDNVSYNNRSYCNITISISYTDKSLRILSADEYGEIGSTNTDCIGYIKSGDKVSNGHHAISVGLEYSGSYPDENFNGKPTSTISSDAFKPSPVELESTGTAKFKVWTMADTGTKSVISLNGAPSEDISYLPAVFQDSFKVTVYYTCMESGFSGDTEELTCLIGDSDKTIKLVSVNTKFKAQVKVEGFGLLKEPVTVNEKAYPYLAMIDPNKKIWRVYDRVLGSKNNTLIAKESCATDPNIIAYGSRIKIMLGDELISVFNSDTFVAADTGSGIQGNHIDLYWGCDTPSPNNQSIPAGLAQSIASGAQFRVILLSE